MRGDVALTARLLLRGAGLAGVATSLGGLLIVAGAIRPWSVSLAEVSMLGEADVRTVAVLRGVPHAPGGWVAVTAGLVIVVLGAAVAVDRPPRWSRGVLVAAAALAVVAAVVHLLVIPEPARIAGAEAADLLALRERLPVGVDLELRAAAASGPWWVVAGGVLAAVGAGFARDR